MEETWNAEATVTEVVEELKVASVQTATGARYAVNTKTPGVVWETLDKGQRFLLELQGHGIVRVLRVSPL